LIAKATHATGDVMASQLLDMAETSRDAEKSSIEEQQRIFNEQISYQKDRDQRLQDNAR